MGNSAGGTNPSLVEAMFFNKPIFAFDVIYNKETTFNKAFYFRDVESLKKLLQTAESEIPESKESMTNLAEQHYLWKHIAEQYESLF